MVGWDGMHEHLDVEDQLYKIGTTPKFAWDAAFVINHYEGGQRQYWSWVCDGSYWPEGNCTDVNEFVSPGAPKGTAVITDLDISFQHSYVSLQQGREVSVGPGY
jgi:hypothetical protein